MIPPVKPIRGPAIVGALFLSGCDQQTALLDTFTVATQPLDLLTWYLAIVVMLLAAWWVIARVSTPPPRRMMLVAAVLLALGLLFASAPTLMLVTGVVWPSVVIVFQTGTLGAGIIGAVILGTAILLVWKLIAALMDRG